jgi:hypothetical protein
LEFPTSSPPILKIPSRVATYDATGVEPVDRGADDTTTAWCDAQNRARRVNAKSVARHGFCG